MRWRRILTGASRRFCGWSRPRADGGGGDRHRHRAGLRVARQADDDLTARNRQALLGAMDALQAVAPDLSNIEPRLIRILEHASGLKGLRFDADPADAAARSIPWLTAMGASSAG